jgi:hypothetical protein
VGRVLYIYSMNPVIPLHDAFGSVLCVQLQAVIYKNRLYRIYFNDMQEWASWKPRYDKILSGEYRFENTKVVVPHEVNESCSALFIVGSLYVGRNNYEQFLNLGYANDRIPINLFYQLRRWNVSTGNYIIRTEYPWNECFLWERPFRKLVQHNLWLKRRLERRLALALCWTLSDSWLGKMPVELLRQFV